MDKLKCSKCGGSLFFPVLNSMRVYTIYMSNGTPPYEMDYRCSECGNIETVKYPAVYFKEPDPVEVELPENKAPLPEKFSVNIGDNNSSGNDYISSFSIGTITNEKFESRLCTKCIICGSNVELPDTVCLECKDAVDYIKKNKKK